MFLIVILIVDDLYLLIHEIALDVGNIYHEIIGEALCNLSSLGEIVGLYLVLVRFAIFRVDHHLVEIAHVGLLVAKLAAIEKR